MDTLRMSEQEEHRVLAEAWAETSRARGTARRWRLLRALRVRNYRLYVAGQSVSLLGTWMQRLALSWWVYQRTHSALALGLVGGVGQLPALFLAPLAGALVDRWDRQRLLVVTQLLAMLQALGLAWLVLAERATLWPVLLCSVLLGMINAVDMPARQALVGELVEQPADLSNALALNASITNGARLIGPALAGLVIMRLGEGTLFSPQRPQLSGAPGGSTGDAPAAAPHGASPDVPAGRGPRRRALRLGLYAGPCHSLASDGGQSPGDAVSGAHADVCHGYAAWGCTHARETDHGVRGGGDPGGAVSGVPRQGRRVRPGARALDGPLWSGTGGVVVCAATKAWPGSR